jgi:hypothetical protein
MQTTTEQTARFEQHSSNESYSTCEGQTEITPDETSLAYREGAIDNEDENFCEYENLYVDIVNILTAERFAHISLIEFAQRVGLSCEEVRQAATVGHGTVLELESCLWVGFSKPEFQTIYSPHTHIDCRYVFKYHTWDGVSDELFTVPMPTSKARRMPVQSGS